MNGIQQFVSCWMPWLRTVFSGMAHCVALVILRSFLWPSAVSLCRYTLHFVWYWWTVDCYREDCCEHPCTSFCLKMGFCFLGCKPSCGGAGQVSLAFEELLGALHGQTVSHPTSSEWRFKCPHISSSTCYCSSLIITALVGLEWHFPVVWSTFPRCWVSSWAHWIFICLLWRFESTVHFKFLKNCWVFRILSIFWVLDPYQLCDSQFVFPFGVLYSFLECYLRQGWY